VIISLHVTFLSWSACVIADAPEPHLQRVRQQRGDAVQHLAEGVQLCEVAAAVQVLQGRETQQLDVTFQPTLPPSSATWQLATLSWAM
jgi:hypothetical protein